MGLLGPNGAGKTTCFYLMTGLIAAETGSVLIDGHDVTDLPMYRRARLGVGYLPQEASAFRGLSVENNIRVVLEAVEPARNTARRRSTNCWPSSPSAICGIRRPPPCRAGSGGGWRSPAPSRRGPTSCSSTNRWRGSTP